MAVPVSLLPELEDVVQHGSAKKRADTLRRVTGLFLEGAANFQDDHVALFDNVIGCLIEEIEAQALAELAHRIAPVPNAPTGVVRVLAQSDDIGIAGPVLKQARLDETDLKQIAETKGQDHLLALSSRPEISEAIAEVIVQRGDNAVARSIANNEKARLSESAFSALIKRAEQDGVLAERVGLRFDIPPRQFRQLLMQASEVVQKRLLEQTKPETQAEIRRVLAKVTQDVAAKSAPRDYTAALAVVQALQKERKLAEADVADYAKSGKYEETVAALAAVSEVPIEVVDRLINGERSDPVLILARAAGFSWPTVRAIISARPGGKPSSQVLDTTRENYDRLTAVTAQRVVRFWQVRQNVNE